MATVVPRNQGKTDFVTDVLKKNAYANAKSVNEEWLAAGRDGTISETLVNKMRAALGLTGNLRGANSKRSAGVAADKPKYTGKKRGRKPKSAALESASSESNENGKPGDVDRVKTSGRLGQLTSLEAEIDVLLFKVMNVGGLEEIENSLRRTRRMLYGAIESKHS